MKNAHQLADKHSLQTRGAICETGESKSRCRGHRLTHLVHQQLTKVRVVSYQQSYLGTSSL